MNDVEMTNIMTVSIPLFNAKHYVRACVESVISQESVQVRFMVDEELGKGTAVG